MAESVFAFRTAVLLAAALATPTFAQVDTVKVLVKKDETVGRLPADPATGVVPPAAALASYGFIPADANVAGSSDRFYAAGFNGTGQDIRLIENPYATTPSITRLITNGPYTKFVKGGNLNNGGGVPSPASLLLNEQAIGALPAYSAAFIADNGAIVTDGTGNRADLTQRIYRYNLALDTNTNATDEMTSLVTLQQMKDALGLAGSITSNSSLARQLRLSPDASTVYFADGSLVFGGLWSVPSSGGTVRRLVADSQQNLEPSVVTVDGSDRVLLNGTINSPGGSNDGGLDYYDTADSTRKVLMTKAALGSFLETTGSITIQASGSDDAGNIYFTNSAAAGTTGDRRGIYKLDPQGRLIKVVSFAERTAAVAAATGANPVSGAARIQTRTTPFEGSAGAFDVTQVMYAEQSANVSAIAGAYAFKPGDFNRDNAFTAADGALLAAKLTPLATVTPIAVADSRYDLNGNNLVNFRDVKILQSFIGFYDGDANFDLTVNFADLVALASNYNQPTGQTWVRGDFNGDDAVNFPDLVLLAQNYNRVVPTAALVELGGASFAADWALAQSLVPEPGSALATLALAAFTSRRRRSMLVG